MISKLHFSFPKIRNKLNETCLAHLDDYLKGEEKSTTLNLYLQELKLGQRKVLKSGRTWPLSRLRIFVFLRSGD